MLLKHRFCLEPPHGIILPSVAKLCLRVLKALESGCAFKTSLLRGTTGVRARSDFDNGE